MDIKNLTLQEKCSLLSGRESWYTTAIKEKDIPSIVMHDGPHGVRISGVENTVYPNLSLLACSFDRDAVYQIGKLIGNDCVKNNTDVLLAPGANLKRTVTGGRNFEYFSEDYLLTGELASAYVKGVQETGTSATLKHFCCNNQENYRMSTSSEVESDVLFNTYFKPFKRVIEKAKPDCVMTSYNLVNGERTNESEFLQKNILRDKFAFDGVIMSDWGAVVDKPKAVAGGCDLEMPGGNLQHDKNLYDAVIKGEVDEKAVDNAVEKVLALIEKHVYKNKQSFDYDVENIVSDIIADSVVLLKNDNSVLPLNKCEKIGVYGDCATNPIIQGGGCANVQAGQIKTPYEILSQTYETVFVQTGGDLSQFNSVDKIVAFVCGNSTDSEAYDRADILIKEQEQKDLIELAKLGKGVCVVLQGGGALAVDDLPCDSLMASYYGGQFYSQGLIKVLSGKSPSGRLAETFPVKLENSPAYLGSAYKYKTEYREGNYLGYKYYEKKRIEPAYPFGFGLSYANIKYNSFILENDVVKSGGSFCGKIEIENTSDIPTKEVIQIYYKNDKTKQLVYFDKVSLKANEKKTVEFKISFEEFVWYADGEYCLPTENGKLILGKNAKDDIYEIPVSLISNKSVEINENMLIEDLVNIGGAEAVLKFFAKVLGLALYSNENHPFKANGKLLSDNEFDHKCSMMMPLKNLPSFVGSYTKEDLNKAMKDFQEYVNNKI
ncbi:MAG: glycoside hydrolase family 3 C-terminal domain-containing protein [Clostridia bacterium]|nr:glycoside hydrolase family 3 C-terminal domain-containing protein [Clostridia bacterium]